MSDAPMTEETTNSDDPHIGFVDGTPETSGDPGAPPPGSSTDASAVETPAAAATVATPAASEPPAAAAEVESKTAEPAPELAPSAALHAGVPATSGVHKIEGLHDLRVYIARHSGDYLHKALLGLIAYAHKLELELEGLAGDPKNEPKSEK